MTKRLGPRFGVEAAFIVAVAVILGLLEVSWVTIVAGMAVAWLVAATIEVVLSRHRPVAVASEEPAVAAAADETFTIVPEGGESVPIVSVAERPAVASAAEASADREASSREPPPPALDEDLVAVTPQAAAVPAPEEPEAEPVVVPAAEAEPAPGEPVVEEAVTPEPPEPALEPAPIAAAEAEPEPEPEAPEPEAAAALEPEPEPELEPEPVPEPVAAQPEPHAAEAVPEPEPEEAPIPPPPPVLTPVPPPVPEPVPAASAEPERPAREPVIELHPGGAREWNLWELERVARERGGADPLRDEEWSFLLMYLREFASADGLLPRDFDQLVRETFGDALHALR